MHPCSLFLSIRSSQYWVICCSIEKDPSITIEKNHSIMWQADHLGPMPRKQMGGTKSTADHAGSSCRPSGTWSLLNVPLRCLPSCLARGIQMNAPICGLDQASNRTGMYMWLGLFSDPGILHINTHSYSNSCRAQSPTPEGTLQGLIEDVEADRKSGQVREHGIAS